MKLRKILKISDFLITKCVKLYNDNKKKCCLNKLSILYIKDNDNENIKQESKYINKFINYKQNKVLVLSEINNFMCDNMSIIDGNKFKLKLFSNFKNVIVNKSSKFIHINIYLDNYRFISLKFVNCENITSIEDFHNCFNDSELIFYYIILGKQKTYANELLNYDIYYKYNDLILCCKNIYNNNKMQVEYNLLVRSAYKDITDIPTIAPVMLNLIYN